MRYVPCLRDSTFEHLITTSCMGVMTPFLQERVMGRKRKKDTSEEKKSAKKAKIASEVRYLHSDIHLCVCMWLSLMSFDGVAGGERCYWSYLEWSQVPLGLWPVSFGACHAHCFSGHTSSPH